MIESYVDGSPEIPTGIPVFPGTGVPVRIPRKRLAAGDRLDDFSTDYTAGTRERAVVFSLPRTAAQSAGRAP